MNIVKDENGRGVMRIPPKSTRSGYSISAIAILYITLAPVTGCTQSASATYNVAETAVRSALPGDSGIKFDGAYETTPDLRGLSQTPNYKRTFICGYVAYKDETGKSIRARFVYLSHSEDPSQAGQNLLNLEKPEMNYGMRDEANGGKYATPFEFTGWNRTCADVRHPKTFSGVAPESIG
jgi:hypothetical protein